MQTIPHLAKDGQVLHEYDPERSVFLRTMFFLDDPQFSDPAIGPAVRAAGVNALTSGFFENPLGWRDPAPSFERFVDAADRFIGRILGVAEREDLLVYAGGDSIARTWPERDLILRGEATVYDSDNHETGERTVTFPHGKAAVQYAIQLLVQGGRTPGIAMCDEADMMFGSAFPTEDARTLKQWISEVPGAPPRTWPLLGSADPETVRAWLREFSDYADIFHNPLPGDDTAAYPDRFAFPQFVRGWDRSVVGWPLDPLKPRMMLTPAAGELYVKRESGPYYSPGKDIMRAPGTPPTVVASSVLYAVAHGCCGVRVYGFEPDYETSGRQGSSKAGKELQTMSHPTLVGTPRWRAMSNVFNWIARNEPLCFMPMAEAPEMPEYVVAGVREGDAGRLVVVVNMSERVQDVEVQAKGERTIFFGERVETFSSPGPRETIVLDAGESAAWVERA